MLTLWVILIGLFVRDGYAGFCTQSYTCTEKCFRSERFHSKCGLFSWSTCTRYRLVLYTCVNTCYRQVCCPGFTGYNCNIPTYHKVTTDDTRREPAITQSTAIAYSAETASESTTGDQGQTSITNESTTQTNQEVYVESNTTAEVTDKNLSENTGLESTTIAHGLKSNISTSNSIFTTKVYDFNSDDVMELHIVILVCGCIFLVLLVYTCIVCILIYRKNKNTFEKCFIVRLMGSCLCFCCWRSYSYMYRRKRIRWLERSFLYRAKQSETNSTRVWQEDQQLNISYSIKMKGDAFDNKILEKEVAASSLCRKDQVEHEKDETVIGAIKERILPEDDFQICVVKPLKGQDCKTENHTSLVPVPNKPFEEHDESSLDWDTIFLFLMKLIQPAEWKLFGTQLLGNKQEVDLIATETSNNIKLCIWNLLKKWHVVRGRRANRGEIEDAMAKLDWNLQLDDFRNFMKNPPLIQDQNLHKQIIELTEYTGEENLYKSLLTKYRSGRNLTVCAARDFEQRSLENIQVLREDDTRNIICHSSCSESTGYQELNGSAYANMENQLVVRQSSVINNGNVKWQKKHKRKLQYADDAHAIAQKRRKKSKRSSIRHKHFPDRRKLKKQNGKSNICAKLANWDDISKSCIINLIKLALPLENHYLQEKEYNLFLDFTVSCILEQTGKPEDMILSIRIDDYRDAQKVKTKSRENYVIDTHTTSLLLDKEGWEQLQLYKLHARGKVLHKIRQDTGSQLDSVYLFIRYDGQPLIEQVNNDSDRKQTEESTTTDNREASFNESGQSGGDSILEESTRYNSSVEQDRLNGNSDHKKKENGDTENIILTHLNDKYPTFSGHNKAKHAPECKSTNKWEVFV